MARRYMKIELKTLDKINPQQLVYHANNINISKYLNNSFPYPYTLNHALNFINHSLNNHLLDFGITVNDECIGCIHVAFCKDIYCKDCEIGYWISELYWNLGIMSQVLHLLLPFLFENYNIHKIYAEVFASNNASIHLLEKMVL